MTDLRATLVVLRTRVDQHFADAQARSPTAFACAPGCASCCSPRFSVFEIEAVAIREALAALPPSLRERVGRQGRDPQLGHCALLVDRRCTVYEQRPMICRSHGLAIAIENRIDHCPLNYTDDVEVPRASVLDLDAVNRPLALLAEMWSAGGGRVGLDELARGETSPGSDPCGG